jgi:magnesium-transporting ATPase (P-type)
MGHLGSARECAFKQGNSGVAAVKFSLLISLLYPISLHCPYAPNSSNNDYKRNFPNNNIQMDVKMKIILTVVAFMAISAIIATVLAELHPWYSNNWKNTTNLTITESISNPFVANRRLLR